MRIRVNYRDRLDRAGVAGAFKKDRHSLEDRFDPLSFCLFHPAPEIAFRSTGWLYKTAYFRLELIPA
jgi:hypothetical protein